MFVADHLTLSELQAALRQETDLKLFQRLQIVEAARRGQTAGEVAETFLTTQRTVKRWVKRYNEEGLNGLKTRKGQGRKGPLDEQQLERFRQRVLEGATPQDQVCTLRGKDFQAILKDEFGVVRSLDAVYQLLHRMGFESLQPRPRHAQADEEAQQAFQKNSGPD